MTHQLVRHTDTLAGRTGRQCEDELFDIQHNFTQINIVGAESGRVDIFHMHAGHRLLTIVVLIGSRSFPQRSH